MPSAAPNLMKFIVTSWWSVKWCLHMRNAFVTILIHFGIFCERIQKIFGKLSIILHKYWYLFNLFNRQTHRNKKNLPVNYQYRYDYRYEHVQGQKALKIKRFSSRWIKDQCLKIIFDDWHHSLPVCAFYQKRHSGNFTVIFLGLLCERG